MSSESITSAGALWLSAAQCGALSGFVVHDRLASPWQRALKRASDLVLAGIASLIVLPLVPLLALLVKATSSGPVFYGHERIGRDQRVFRVWKFRTSCLSSGTSCAAR